MQNVEVIYLDGSNNIDALMYRIKKEMKSQKDFIEIDPKIRVINFKSQSELLIVLHSLGLWAM